MNNQNEILLTKLAEKIKARRNELNISQEKLAEKCSFDRTYISLLERSKRNLSFSNLNKLCNGLEISLSDLLKGI
ncbi:MAG: helix-turn-helix transcriptional regulator [Campylobacterota bacterium]|nr:helix-turn-helix transcriptional regulator [Campylobacterota bacterium]